MPGPKLRMSMPEQNPRPAPVRTTTLTEASVAIAASVSVSSSRITSLIALSCLGRFSCSTTTPALRPVDDQRLGHRTQRRGKPSTCWAMMLRWISEVPPAMVPPKLRA